MSVFIQESNAELVENLFFLLLLFSLSLCPNCFLNVFCLHSAKEEEEDEEIISIALHLLACTPLPSSVNDRDVIKMGPSASARQTAQKTRKKKKKDLSSTIFLLRRLHLFIIQSCPLLINNMPIVVSSTHLASALTPRTIFRFSSPSSSSLALVYSWLMARSVWSERTNQRITISRKRTRDRERERERKRRDFLFLLLLEEYCISSSLVFFSNKQK